MSTRNAAYLRAELPPDEEERLEELYSLKLLDTASELRFDHYTQLIAEIFDFPIVLVNFLDRDRQWFKSSCGLDVRETDRDVSFCSHTILQHGVLVVADTHEDPRFENNPLVTGDMQVRFYAGTVVHGPRGHALGTLCLIDHRPRHFDEAACLRLRRFADLVENEVRHNYDLEVLRSSIEFSAYFDPLTRLPNRRLLRDRLQKLVEVVESEERHAAVLLFKVQDLHLINQTLGSSSGEQLLIELGERLQTCCPLGGTVARLHNDEFVLAFPALRDELEQIEKVAADARESLRSPFSSEQGEHYVAVLVGGSVFPEHGQNADALIEAASAAIRCTSRDTAGAVRFFDEAESLGLVERLKIESRLRGAVANHALDLVYQPIVSLRSGKPVAMEALLRWRDPQLGELRPEQFIPVAEQTGLALPIGRQVQAQVCRQLKAWRQADGRDIPVAINVAAPELLQPKFAASLLAELTANDLPPSLLCVEVTETSLLHDSPVVSRNLQELAAAQVQLHIDDFGTGYSSLAYLRDMPVSSLKIDRSFVRDLPNNPQQAALVEAILNMAKSLGLETIAEGVDCQEQLDYLRESSCQCVQGYLLSAPLPPEQVQWRQRVI